MPANLSKEDEAQFEELKNTQSDLQRQMVNCRGKLDMRKKLLRKSELTLAEVHDVKDDTNTYKAVGRMFIMAPLPKIREEIKDILANTMAEITTLKTKEKYVTKQLEENQGSMKSLITGK